MTLTTRLLAFFLTMLAFVLIGFSVAIYALAYGYLHRQVLERLDTVLNTIVGAIEAGPEGVEWEPADRPQSLEFLNFDSPVVWRVADGQGEIVDQSRGAQNLPVLEGASGLHDLNAAYRDDRRWRVGSWAVVQRSVRAGSQQAELVEGAQAAPDEEEVKYRMLSITAGINLNPVRSTLRRLAATLSGVAGVTWLLALGSGRFVCRRALLPVRQMATSAGEIHAADLTRRIPPLTRNDELDELRRAFNQLLDRLQEAFQRERQFTGDASHQLRTPLAAMLGQLEVALRRHRSTADYRQVIETVHQRAAHLARMVEALLFLARTDAEAAKPALERLDLNVWLPSYLPTWSEHPRFTDIVLEKAQEASVVCVQPSLLAELLNILLDNACKYSPAGTPITVRLEQTEPSMLLSVIDHGWGIEPGEFGHITASQLRQRGRVVAPGSLAARCGFSGRHPVHHGLALLGGVLRRLDDRAGPSHESSGQNFTDVRPRYEQ